MKWIVTCHKCGAKSPSQKWRKLGWLKVELFYDDGNKWRQYTCKQCQIDARPDPTPEAA